RIQTALDRAIEQAVRQETVRREGDFVWPGEMGLPVLRDRSGLPATARKLDLVAPEEIALVSCLTLIRSYPGRPWLGEPSRGCPLPWLSTRMVLGSRCARRYRRESLRSTARRSGTHRGGSACR